MPAIFPQPFFHFPNHFAFLATTLILFALRPHLINASPCARECRFSTGGGKQVKRGWKRGLENGTLDRQTIIGEGNY